MDAVILCFDTRDVNIAQDTRAQDFYKRSFYVNIADQISTVLHKQALSRRNDTNTIMYEDGF